MTYNEVLNALGEISEFINNYEFDPAKRTYYGIAIDGARKLLDMRRKPCANCPYNPVRPTYQQGKAYCGACGKRIPLKINAHYCHKCGREINWG